jgi:hypothetical protein
MLPERTIDAIANSAVFEHNIVELPLHKCFADYSYHRNKLLPLTVVYEEGSHLAHLRFLYCTLLLVTNAVAMQRNLVDMLVQDLGYDSVSLPTLLVEVALAFEHSAADRALHFTVIEVRLKLLVFLITRYQ